nr:hypothetical protein [Tanacetum cinerariifolium]
MPTVLVIVLASPTRYSTTEEKFPEDIAELVRHRYPSQEKRLFDDVLATFVLHHPEHGHSVILPIISCIIDGTMEYNRNTPPCALLIALVCQAMIYNTCSEMQKEYSEQSALACGEVLRVITHYNRPIFKAAHHHKNENKPLRPLSPCITDILIAAPLGAYPTTIIQYGGVKGKYAAGKLKPPSVVMAFSRGSGKHPQLVPSTPRWAVAKGAGEILSVCDEEVARYKNATLTATVVSTLLLPPPATSMDEHLVAGLPALEPYARTWGECHGLMGEWWRGSKSGGEWVDGVWWEMWGEGEQ